MGNFQNGRLGRQLRMKTQTDDNNWLRKADELSVLYCFASDSAAAYNSSSEAEWQQDGGKQNSKCHGDGIHTMETFIDLGASSIHGSEKCVDRRKTVLG